MLVSQAKQLIYTETGKMTSTFVEIHFVKYCVSAGDRPPQRWRSEYMGPEAIVGYRRPNAGQNTWFNHMSAAAIRRRIGHQMWDRYFIISTVRNRFDLPLWFYRLKERSGQLTNYHTQDPVNGFRNCLAKGFAVISRTQEMVRLVSPIRITDGSPGGNACPVR